MSASEYKNHWNEFARDILRVKLDQKQQEILHSIQINKRISMMSGHAIGKDFLCATASICFLYLYRPSKVINTAPTGRQVTSVMMSEIGNIYRNARKPLGGELQASKIVFPSEPNRYLIGFKASDKSAEAWHGFHSPNIMVVVTEAPGINQDTFDAIEGLLVGNYKLVLAFNPGQRIGETYRSSTSKDYHFFQMSCLDAINVQKKKTIIPGQVDWDWVNDKVRRWCVPIRAEEFKIEEQCFKWKLDNGEEINYLPNDLFRVKVLGNYGKESPDQLIPLSWIELSNQRWHEWNENGHKLSDDMRLGVDVAGMGRDRTVFVERHKNVVSKIEYFQQAKHMETAGRVKIAVQHGGTAFVDTIGEGAGVYSRLEEQGVKAVSAKFSESAENLNDVTGQIDFSNMRSYCYYAIRDALDPQGELKLAMPPDDDLTADLTETKIVVKSSGKYAIEEKDKIKQRLGRSPDTGDALALTFYPWGTGTGESMWSAKVREE